MIAALVLAGLVALGTPPAPVSFPVQTLAQVAAIAFERVQGRCVNAGEAIAAAVFMVEGRQWALWYTPSRFLLYDNDPAIPDAATVAWTGLIGPGGALEPKEQTTLDRVKQRSPEVCDLLAPQRTGGGAS